VETPRNRQPSDTSARQKASNELVMLIRKLRWLGMEEEAQGLENELGRRRAAVGRSVTLPDPPSRRPSINRRVTAAPSFMARNAPPIEDAATGGWRYG
jgi:hypothetical protein